MEKDVRLWDANGLAPSTASHGTLLPARSLYLEHRKDFLNQAEPSVLDPFGALCRLPADLTILN